MLGKHGLWKKSLRRAVLSWDYYFCHMPEEKSKLYLIPCSLGEPGPEQLPSATLQVLETLDLFIVERARTARRFIKACFPTKDISQLEIVELDKHDAKKGIKPFIEALKKKGKSAGLLSEAGCPGVADPGAYVVDEAHKAGLEIVPMVGPSSILLALMASGMNGQSFAFQGYLPVKKPELSKMLRQLEERVARTGQTQIFIEAPYRNQSLISTAVDSLKAETRFCMAMDLTLPTEVIISQKMKDWKKVETAAFHKRPAIFIIGR